MLALWLIVLDDDAYMAIAMIQLWVARDKISYDSWGHVVGVQIRFMDDCGWPFWWCAQDIWYVAYMVIFARTRRRTNLEYTTSLFDDEPLIFSYDGVIMPSKMHKVHMMQLWCNFPIVLGSHMVEDCCCWWYQESLTNDHELMVC